MIGKKNYPKWFRQKNSNSVIFQAKSAHFFQTFSCCLHWHGKQAKKGRISKTMGTLEIS